jgi:hypothetical protein
MKQSTRLTLAALISAALTLPAYAQSTSTGTTATTLNKQTSETDPLALNKGQTNVANKIAGDFTLLAGSKENAYNLVTALRNGTEVKLTTTTTGTGGGTGTTTSTTFDPPTGKMGWGNVSHSLALAQSVLKQAGITEPTAAQLQAALMGGEITGANGKVVTLEGILTQRASGMGWGEIAHANGTKMGSAVSSVKTNGKGAATTSTTSGTSTTTADSGTKVTAKSTAATTAGGKGTVTAAGATAGGPKGVTSAAGGQGVGQGNKGITTASGTAAGTHGAKGLTTASGAMTGTGSGIVSAEGPKGGGNAYGRGMVTAAGGGASAGTTAALRGNSAGVVSATGASAGAGITTATGNGNAGGNGNGNGHGKGKGG